MKSIYRTNPMDREVQVMTTLSEEEVRMMHQDIRYLVVTKVADKIAEKMTEKIMPVLDKLIEGIGLEVR